MEAVPRARVVGHALLLLCVALHNVFILRDFDAAAFTRFALGVLLYSAATTATLRLAAGRVGPARLGAVFLVTDIVVWALAIYVSGGDRSWLFWLMFMRAADLQLSGPRAVLLVGHVSTLCYVAMLGWLIGVARELLAGRDAAVADLHQSEHWYRALFDTVSDPIMTSTLDGRITGVNRAFTETLGYSWEELIGRHDLQSIR